MPARKSSENTIQGAVYNELKKSILDMKLTPGSAMSTLEIANRLGVSRTPVREAFIRLQREGLVIAIPQKETIVSQIDLKRVEQERFIRESLELGVIPLFLENCSRKDFAEMEELIERQKKCAAENDYVGFLREDDEFHHILFTVAGQELAWEAIINTNGHYNRIRRVTVQKKETLESAIRQHEELLRMLQHGELEKIQKELEIHVRKINEEKKELITRYPDYFVQEQKDPSRIIIGSL